MWVHFLFLKRSQLSHLYNTTLNNLDAKKLIYYATTFRGMNFIIIWICTLGEEFLTFFQLFYKAWLLAKQISGDDGELFVSIYYSLTCFRTCFDNVSDAIQVCNLANLLIRNASFFYWQICFVNSNNYT